MNLYELAARNVSAALREAMNAESVMMLSLGLKFPIDWKALRESDAQAELLMRNLIAVCEELSTVQDVLRQRYPMVRGEQDVNNP
jgi:hypothetical protein